MKQKSKFLRRILINKVLMATIPIIILGIVLIEFSYRFNVNKFDKLQTTSFNASITTFEERYEDLLVMVSRIQDDGSVGKANFSPNEISFDVLELLKIAALPRTFFADFILIPSDNNYAYTAAYTTSLKENINNPGGNIIFSVTTKEELFLYASDLQEIKIFPVQNIKLNNKDLEAITICFPIKTGFKTIGVLLAIIESINIKTAFGGTDGLNYGTIIYNGNTLIYSEIKDNLKSFDELEFNYSQIKTVKQGKENYYITKTYFADLNIIRYVRSSAWQNENFSYMMFGIIIILCFVWIGFFIYISIRIEYRPIANISKNLKNLIFGEKPNESEANKNEAKLVDEIELVNDMINILRKINLQGVKEECVGNERLNDLLKGVSEEFSFNKSFQNYIVLIAFCNQMDKLYKNLEEISIQSDNIAVEYTLYGERLVLAIGYENNKNINNFINNLSIKLNEQVGSNFKIAIGNETVDILKIRQSFFNAEVTLNYMNSKCIDGALYSDFVFTNTHFQNRQAIEILSRFDYYLKIRDGEGLEKTLGDIEKFILDPESSPDICRMMLLFVKNNFLYEFYNSAKNIEKDNLYKLFQIEIKNVNIMLMIINVLRQYVTDLLINKEKTESPTAIDKKEIESYIKENYLEKDFSLYTLSENFGYNPSVFSRLFKNFFGVNFRKYLDSLKMNTAKKLLSETKLSVEEISEKLNYSNPSNFIRAFRSEFLMSPGQFRTKINE